MARIQKYGYLLAVMLVLVMGFGSPVYAGSNRLSLSPYGVLAGNGASLISSGFDAPLRLPAKASTPSFTLGFTIPKDYVPDTPLKIIILWETLDTQCTFYLRPNLLFRARAGHPRDFGAASGGLEAVNASTSFSLTGSGIVMEAPLAAHETARVRFKIVPTPGEFPTLQAGDAVNFGIFREDRDTTNDTCDQELGIAGISIVYTTP
jgi:hypothetical protein